MAGRAMVLRARALEVPLSPSPGDPALGAGFPPSVASAVAGSLGLSVSMALAPCPGAFVTVLRVVFAWDFPA